MAKLNFTIDQDDGLNVWIKQTLQDELTGAEFSKLENVLENERFQNVAISDLNDCINHWLQSGNLTGIELGMEYRTEIKELIEKSKEILLEHADGLSADDIREICQVEHKVPGGSYDDEISENNAIAIMKFFLSGKEFRAIKEWLNSYTNEIENDLLEKITATLKAGLEICPILAVVGAHNVAFRE